MTNSFRAAYLALIFLIILTLASACGGADPVSSGASPDAGLIGKVNTDGVKFDGAQYTDRDTAFTAAPGSSHLVEIDPLADNFKFPYRATCTDGLFRVDGVNIGKRYTSSNKSLEWQAPDQPCTVQLMFESSNYKLGVVVEVTTNIFKNASANVSYDKEVSFASPVTGKMVKAASGEFLVKLTPKTPITDILSLRKAQDYKVMERIRTADPVYRIKLDSGIDEAKAWQDLKADPRVAIVEPNYIVYPASVPADPHYSEKFEFPKIDAPQAWDMETGSPDVWVAVLDTGVDRNHPDLKNNVVPGADFIDGGDGLGGETPGDGLDNNEDGAIDQNIGHGTHVAGIIAAEANNGAGACGIAYNTHILPLRIFPANGDTGATFSSIIEAVDYAAVQDKVKVISMSIGTTYESSILQDAINGAWASGKVLVAAAANSNTDEKYFPAAHQNVVAVAALNKTGQKASFSNYGDWVDISSYGTGIYSTYFDDQYAYMSGTSMACPLVSGCFALLFSYKPDLTNADAVEYLTAYSNDVDKLNPGFEGKLGKGIVNPYLALSAISNSKPGEIGDGDSDGKTSDSELQLGPHTGS
jgi:thermitase